MEIITIIIIFTLFVQDYEMTNVQKQFIKDFFMVLKAKLKAHNGKVIVQDIKYPLTNFIWAFILCNFMQGLNNVL
jgi:hypothetical protein